MTEFWERLFGLNQEMSLWVEEEELGKEKAINHRGGSYSVKIPQTIERPITLRLKGLGKSRGRTTGDLLLHLWLNKGEDVRKDLWLSETFAKVGGDKDLVIDGQHITLRIPPNSRAGLTLRLAGLGRSPRESLGAPPLNEKKNGQALVKLHLYPDTIRPRYESVDTLSTESMALEGWVYRKFDEVISKLGRSSLPNQAIHANEIASLFNDCGWTSIFNALAGDLKLSHLALDLSTSAPNSPPGSCQKMVTIQDNQIVERQYTITINKQFLDNPFAVAAILAHELCHVVYAEKIDDPARSADFANRTQTATLEEERTVDLLVFMFRIGEFQLRVARDTRLALGYFNQEVFERMQVIVARKLNW